jgi:hypothetical protein
MIRRSFLSSAVKTLDCPSHYLENIFDFAKDGPVWEFLDRSLRAGR